MAKNTKDDLHVHMIFRGIHTITRAKDAVKRYGGTNIKVALAPGNVLRDLWFDIDVKEKMYDNNPLDLIVEAYKRNRPEPNEWDP